MNIIIIADVNFPEGMAATAHIILMAKGLIKNGASVLLIIPSKSFNGREKTFNKNEGIFDTIPYKFFNKYGKINNTFTYNSLKNVADIAKYLKSRKKRGIDDVVITYCNDFLKYFPIFLMCYFNKISLFPWEVEKRISNKERKHIRSKLQHVGYKISDMILPKISDGMIVISSYLRSYYGSKINANKIHVSPILVNEDDSKNTSNLQPNNVFKKFIDDKKKEYNIIVYSGTVGEKDGFPYILCVFKKLLNDYPHSLLVTTGKPSKYNPMKNILKQIDDMEMSDHFKYLGLVSREELKYVNQNAHLLLVCRSNSEFANYGFPWKLGEYLMTKNPIVATKVGDIEKYLINDKEIFLAEPENSDSIYNKMNEVFSNYRRAKEIALNGYNKALNVFDYKLRSKELIDFMNTVLIYK